MCFRILKPKHTIPLGNVARCVLCLFQRPYSLKCPGDVSIQYNQQNWLKLVLVWGGGWMGMLLKMIFTSDKLSFKKQSCPKMEGGWLLLSVLQFSYPNCLKARYEQLGLWKLYCCYSVIVMFLLNSRLRRSF